MRPYTALARHYDALTWDVPYREIADYIEAHFKSASRPVRAVLDMACGTGTIACILAGRGYEVIGTDSSADMLAMAADKASGMERRPTFINQPMEALELPFPVDAAVCLQDAINYIEPEKLPGVFRRVRALLDPGGVFLFDVLKPRALEALDGEVFLDERDRVFCVWRAEFDKKEGACRYVVDIFEREGKKWGRSTEEHVEYAHEVDTLKALLLAEGFSEVLVCGDRTFAPPRRSDRRAYFLARVENAAGG